MKTKLRTLASLLLVLGLSLALRVAPVAAATVSIAGGTFGADCTSGGYFTPSSATITSGDTVTISVPANDPYAGGVEVHGFSQGSFVVARGGSVTTNAVTANVSYYGTWPSTGCMKGTGTIMVNASVQPVVTAPPSAGSSTSTPTTTSSSSTSAAKTAAAAPKASVATPSPSATPSVTPTPSPKATQNTKSKVSNKPLPSATPVPNSPAIKTVAAVSGGSLAVLVVAAVVLWHFVIRPRRQVAPQPTIIQPPESPQTPNQGGPPTISNQSQGGTP
jgi:hypothetical protein